MYELETYFQISLGLKMSTNFGEFKNQHFPDKEVRQKFGK
jgi:hypothetical protein